MLKYKEYNNLRKIKIEKSTCTINDLSLFQIPNVEYIEMHHSHINENLINLILHNKKSLVILDFNIRTCLNFGMDTLSQLENLRILDLYNNVYDLDEEDISKFQKFKFLHTLRIVIKHSKLNHFINVINKMPVLKYLDLRVEFQPENNSKYYIRFDHIKYLIFGTSYNYYQYYISFSKPKNVEKIQFFSSNINITETNLNELSNIQSFYANYFDPKLNFDKLYRLNTRIDINQNKDYFRLRNLLSLNLTIEDINKKIFVYDIEQLKYLTRLKYLTITFTKGEILIDSIKYLHNLESFKFISDNSVSYKHLKSISKLPNIKDIELFLDLEPNITKISQVVKNKNKINLILLIKNGDALKSIKCRHNLYLRAQNVSDNSKIKDNSIIIQIPYTNTNELIYSLNGQIINSWKKSSKRKNKYLRFVYKYYDIRFILD